MSFTQQQTLEDCFSSFNNQLAINIDFFKQLGQLQQQLASQLISEQQTFITALSKPDDLASINEKTQAFTGEVSKSVVECFNQVVDSTNALYRDSIAVYGQSNLEKKSANSDTSNTPQAPVKKLAKTTTKSATPAATKRKSPAKTNTTKANKRSTVSTKAKVAPKAESHTVKQVAKKTSAPVKKPATKTAKTTETTSAASKPSAASKATAKPATAQKSLAKSLVNAAKEK
ncbi:hypothetical protein MHM98_04600 [Psychrobium sp. MM17-31]|uniref:hypothetical protein n=1 Tax=Psychrobium sp. MM17-31 TaxID=2917758 RepID=UPI001EF605A6|nr:hypothetical protein [Psychrobium sp. MM17-31]MCG7530636.1 hypothetical protein [Psychrobium sp. MM17-31]